MELLIAIEGMNKYSCQIDVSAWWWWSLFFFLGGCCFDKVAKSEFLNGNLPTEVLADILCF